VVYSKSFGIYVKELRKVKPLTREETLALVREYKLTSSKEVLDMIVTGNLRLVMLIAKEYRDKGLDYEDLIEEGNVGLASGARRYDPARGAKFSYYVAMWIRQAMLAAIAKSGKVVSIPFDKFTKSNRAKKDERLGLESNEAHKIDCTATPLDKVFGLSDAEASVQATNTEVEDLLRTLDSSESFIMRNLYGLGGGDPLSLKEIGELMQVSKNKVSEMRDEAIKKMRKALTERV
jgi:RNA polymerase primary sigma factor